MVRKVFIPTLTNVLNQKMSAFLFAATLIASTLGPAPYAIRSVAASHGTEKLTLSVSSGQMGTFVTVHGSGFWVNTSGFVFFDQNFDYQMNTGSMWMCGPLSEQRCEPWTDISSDSNGNFTTTITIPPGKKANFLGAGTYFVGANLPIGGGSDRSVPFIVPATFDVKVFVGGLRISGSNFAPFKLDGTPSQGRVWVDTNNNFEWDQGELQVGVYVLPGGSLSGCASSPCHIKIPANLKRRNTATTVRVNIVHEADTNRSVEQKVEASRQLPFP